MSVNIISTVHCDYFRHKQQRNDFITWILIRATTRPPQWLAQDTITAIHIHVFLELCRWPPITGKHICRPINRQNSFESSSNVQIPATIENRKKSTETAASPTDIGTCPKTRSSREIACQVIKGPRNYCNFANHIKKSSSSSPPRGWGETKRGDNSDRYILPQEFTFHRKVSMVFNPREK